MSDEKSNPYLSAGPKSFWRTGVFDNISQINYEIYSKKFEINKQDKIATAGSCFAQHIGGRLRGNKFNVLDYEPIRNLAILKDDKTLVDPSDYSAKYGNIYTVRQLLQLVKEAFVISTPENIVWQNQDGKFIDSLRPGIFPDGFDSPEEVLFHRKFHISRVRALFEDMDLFIFTLGLTEAWRHKKSGTIYPMVPGSIGGEFDADIYEFVNFTYEEIKNDLIEIMSIIDSATFKKKYLFTVSPVPLTATATDEHVMVATTYSKSVLRAVAGDLYNQFSNIDYFPSYEIVINPWTSTPKYANNQRSVLSSAVDEVMKIFLNQHDHGYIDTNIANQNSPQSDFSTGSKNEDAADAFCQEILLELLNKNKK